MAQYIYTMNRVSKVVPPKRVILKDISLSFFPACIRSRALSARGRLAGTDDGAQRELRARR